VGYRDKDWSVDLNYGEYYPQEIGDAYHDGTIRRAIVKPAYSFTPELRTFGVGIFENKRDAEQWRSSARSVAVLTGLQYEF